MKQTTKSPTRKRCTEKIIKKIDNFQSKNDCKTFLLKAYSQNRIKAKFNETDGDYLLENSVIRINIITPLSAIKVINKIAVIEILNIGNQDCVIAQKELENKLKLQIYNEEKVRIEFQYEQHV